MPVPCPNIVRLRKNQAMPHIYDVELEGIERLGGYDLVELHTVLYPYSRRISSAEVAFYPFEEYVKDVLSRQRSAYAEIGSHFSEVFGLLLGMVIALSFAAFRPQDLLSVQSIVSVFGAYAIGKALWDDIEQALVSMTKQWRVRFQERYYRYQLERHSTLTLYSHLAKRRRYGKFSLLPVKIDFIKQSNSQTLRMCFDARDLRSVAEPVVHVHSIHVDPDLLDEFEGVGYMFGVKLSLNRTFLGVTRSLEMFQSLDRAARGCLDESGNWIEGATFYRKTFSLGRLKIYHSKGLFHGQTVIQA